MSWMDRTGVFNGGGLGHHEEDSGPSKAEKGDRDMRVTLEFDLPEERGEYDAAMQGADALVAISEIRSLVFRPARKYGYDDVGVAALLSRINLETGDLGTELVWELERIYSRVLSKHKILED